jgi:voltage-gated potassium channel
MQSEYGDLLTGAFDVIAAFFVFDYALRLYVAPAAPGGEVRGAWRSRLAWATSLAGVFDLAAAIPGLIALPDNRDATLIGFIWVFKYVRYSPGLSILERVITNARHALLSVLLGLAIVLLAAASVAYLLERYDQPEVFGSIPAALWWAIITVTTTGYGDVVPATPFGRALAGLVMVGGILVLALLAGILASFYADEMRRHAFLNTWKVVAQLPFFQQVGASIIADVARLLRPRDYPPGAVICRRGEPGDCMYFIASGAVEIQLNPAPLRLGSEGFFGEVALLTGAPRNVTVVAVEPCTLLRLDIADFHALLAHQPELARVIKEEAERRPGIVPATASAAAADGPTA